MKKRILSFLSSLLAATMIVTSLAACTPGNEENTTQDSTTESGTLTDTEKNTESGRDEDSATESGDTESGTESDSESETDDVPSPELEGLYGPVIKNAYDLSNNVSHYFSDPDRNNARVENNHMVFDYALNTEGDILATLSNKKGGVYVKNSMDVFVKMKTGKTYYASASSTSARSNSFRYGYYYYDVRFLDHDFVNSATVVDELNLNLKKLIKVKEMASPKFKNNALITTITGAADPNIWGEFGYNADKYNAISITVKTTTSTSLEFFFVAGERVDFSSDQMKKIDIIADGEFHTYTIYLPKDETPDYFGDVTKIRFDFAGPVGEEIQIKELKALEVDYDDAPMLYLDRTLHTYPDKLNQVAHVVASIDVENIDEIGMLTEIAADTVDKLIVYDGTLHDTLDGVNWDKAEYVAFDIKDVGVFGYILLKDETSGKMKVTLEGDTYKIVQTRAPKDGKILAPVSDTSNDFYMGQRIYTDESHDFEAFLEAAYCERNPLSAENFTVNTEMSPKSSYVGYDALRGSYKFDLPPNISFQDSYDNRFNEHNNVVFTVNGDDHERNIYVLAYAFTTDIECAAVLDKNEMMLPIPIEVCKNFKHENEEPMFDRGDTRYSEALFPVILTKDDSYTMKVIHLYQNWGRSPLKQISSIQFFAPYYHLSTGTTETNCISNQYVYGKDLFTLPDHRAMSAPMWEGQPQHSSGGFHYFLQYTDANGNYYASENTVNTITAAGPTYAEIDMVNISDDGKIKVTYTHMEMPQTDENRTYYTMKYEILEDISFKNFLEDFSFYRMEGYYCSYGYIGYLNEKNECVVTEANATTQKKSYVLGDQYPYFDCYKVISGNYVEDYVNLSFLIHSSEFVIGGEKVDPRFAIVDHSNGVSLSLNLGEITLKKGDSFKINAIIMPWGSHESVYDGSNGKAPDQNVRDVRQSSMINPAVATPLSRCEAVESDFVPMIRTTDGKIATFALSGGENNIAVRVYGFTRLTVPKIYERVGDEWVPYKLSSAATPDKLGNAHPYDGYCVHYDGDGTYSYSFIVKMDGGKERNLRIIADTDFTGWTDDDRYPEIENGDEEETETEPFDFYFSPDELKDSSKVGVGEVKVMKENDSKFIRFFGNGTSGEANVTVTPLAPVVTGQYVIVKYRIPTTNPENANTETLLFDVFTSTETLEAAGTNVAYTTGIIADGEWHVMVFDVTKFSTNKEFNPNADGEYVANFVRFDMFNTVYAPESYIDIAYIAMSDSISDICSKNADVEEIILAEGADPSLHSIIATANYDKNKPLYDFYFSPSTLNGINAIGVGEKELLDDDGKNFIRYWGNGESGEAYMTVMPSADVVSGNYVVIKYRIPTTNTVAVNEMYFEVFTSTVNEGALGGVDYAYTYGLIADDQWHVMVIDVTKFTETCKVFTADEDGKFKAKFLRFDVFNQAMGLDCYVDIAYVGMCDSLEKICETNADIPEITLSEGTHASNHKVIDTATAQEKN